MIASQTVVRTIHLVRISDEEKLHETYLDDDAVESTSLYETLPGTLTEGIVWAMRQPSGYSSRCPRAGEANGVTHDAGALSHRRRARVV